jgi:arylsulfatase A-like enzyme
MLRRLLDSPWFYFGGASLLLLAALLTQFEVHVPSRSRGTPADIAKLRDRKDLNLVFIVVDTMRADRLSAYGYKRPTTPILDEIAAHGILFENVVSQSSWTKTSMASMWTATNPIRNGILRYNHVLPAEAVMPAEILRQAGYRTVGLWRNGWVEPNFGFDQGFEIYLRPTTDSTRQRIHRQSPGGEPLGGTDEDLVSAATGFLDRFGHDHFFLYMHFMDLHQYVYDDRSAIFGTSYSDVYDQSVNWVDRLIGLFMTRLDSRGLLGRSVVVIVADHGEAFREHGSEGHARNLYTEVTHVPWIISLPFLLDPGIRVPQTVSNADIWPTLLDLLGLPPLPGADGVSLLPLVRAAGGIDPGAPIEPLVRPVFAQLARGWGNPKATPESLVSVTDQGRQLIVNLEKPDEQELFDMKRDPKEKKNLIATDDGDAKAMRELVKGYEANATSPWGVAPGVEELDELRLNHLRALGYVIGTDVNKGAPPRRHKKGAAKAAPAK